ncbi:MAG: hypothetical protein ACI840_001288 [Ulvibacter sp.]|jgi:hypothetical protein
MNIQKVKFIYAYPFDSGRRRLFLEKNRSGYPELENVRDKTRYWEKIWEEKDSEYKIIETIYNITKSVPDRSLECFVVGGGINPMSTPFIMPVLGKDGERTDDQFIDVMIHELLHIFVSKQSNYFEFIREQYKDEPILVQNHIIIYAFLEKIFTELFNSLPLDYNSDDMPEDYERAIEIVRTDGYENIIKSYYDHLE